MFGNDEGCVWIFVKLHPLRGSGSRIFWCSKVASGGFSYPKWLGMSYSISVEKYISFKIPRIPVSFYIYYYEILMPLHPHPSSQPMVTQMQTIVSLFVEEVQRVLEQMVASMHQESFAG